MQPTAACQVHGGGQTTHSMADRSLPNVTFSERWWEFGTADVACATFGCRRLYGVETLIEDMRPDITQRGAANTARATITVGRPPCSTAGQAEEGRRRPSGGSRTTGWAGTTASSRPHPRRTRSSFARTACRSCRRSPRPTPDRRGRLLRSRLRAANLTDRSGARVGYRASRFAFSSFSIASVTVGSLGWVRGENRAAGLPSRPIRNLAKFHSISPANSGLVSLEVRYR